MKVRSLFLFAAAQLCFTSEAASVRSAPVSLARQLPSFLEVESHHKLDEQNDYLEGVIELGGQKYRATCNCKGGISFEKKAPTCSPSKVKIHQDHGGNGLSVSEVRTLYAQPMGINFGRVAENSFSCLDSRVSSNALGTPGGDFGEFLLALNTYADLVPSGRKLDQLAVDTFFADYLKSFPAGRKFYHCTDDRAVAHIEKQLDITGLDITDPADSIKDQILTVMNEPQNIGDTHLKLILQHPDWYHVADNEVAKMLLKSFFTVLWDSKHPLRDRLMLDVLAATAHPKAFLEVLTNEDCEKADMAPMIKPRNKDVSVIVNHMSAVASRHRELADFFAGRKNGQVVANTFYKRMERHGRDWLEQTMREVAKDLPLYVLSFV
eukprot:GDKI01014416.1.p1 GENE.GDKI01014416.1~~GDKI01014416.1.p1  ORF type:complete len:379 (+),score=59.04 GDKI01014416.1:193-1329(+)